MNSYAFMQPLAWVILTLTTLVIIGSGSGDWIDRLLQLIGGMLPIYIMAEVVYFITSRSVFLIKNDLDRDNFRMIWLHFFLIIFALMVTVGSLAS